MKDGESWAECLIGAVITSVLGGIGGGLTLTTITGLRITGYLLVAFAAVLLLGTIGARSRWYKKAAFFISTAVLTQIIFGCFGYLIL